MSQSGSTETRVSRSELVFAHPRSAIRADSHRLEGQVSLKHRWRVNPAPPASTNRSETELKSEGEGQREAARGYEASLSRSTDPSACEMTVAQDTMPRTAKCKCNRCTKIGRNDTPVVTLMGAELSAAGFCTRTCVIAHRLNKRVFPLPLH